MNYRLKKLMTLLSLSLVITGCVQEKKEPETKLQAFAKKFKKLHPDGYRMKSGWYDVTSTYSYGDTDSSEFEALVSNKATLYLNFDNFGPNTIGDLPIEEGFYTQKTIKKYETVNVFLWLKNGKSIIKEERYIDMNGEIYLTKNGFTTESNYLDYFFFDEYNDMYPDIKWSSDGADNLNSTYQLEDDYLKYYSSYLNFFDKYGYYGSEQTSEFYFFDSNLNVYKKAKHFYSINPLYSSIKIGDIVIEPSNPIEVEFPTLEHPAEELDYYSIQLEYLKYPIDYFRN